MCRGHRAADPTRYKGLGAPPVRRGRRTDPTVDGELFGRCCQGSRLEAVRVVQQPPAMHSLFRYFNGSTEVIRRAVIFGEKVYIAAVG